MPGVVELMDRAVELPPGPQLSATLARIPWSQIPNARLVEVVQAHSRQLAHAQAGLLAGLAEIARATPVAGLAAGEVARAAEDFEWASHEIAAALTWTPTASDRELDFALTLARGLPLVFAALEQGLIDRGKAKVFADHLDPARGELTPAQIRRLCERFVPLAPRLTARQLSRRLLAAIQAIDPEYHRRRYRRGLRERGVVLHLNRDGTATLSGEGLPPDEAAAAAARLDRLAEAAKRAGHPARLGQITADLYLGMIDGSLHGFTEAQILAQLLAHRRPDDIDIDGSDGSDGSEDIADVADTGSGKVADETSGHSAEADAGDPDATPDTGRGDLDAADLDAADVDAADVDPADTDPADTDPADTDSTVEFSAVESSPVDRTACGEADEEVGPDEESACDSQAERGPTSQGPTSESPVGESPVAAGPARAGSTGAGEDRWHGDGVGVREGIELRVGLATVLGCDERPAEIPGLGPVDAQIARAAVTRQRRGAAWQFAIVDTDGHLLLAGPLRRRPRPGAPPGSEPPGRVRGGVVELHLTLAELYRFAADPDTTGDWAGVVAEVADRWAERHRLWRELARDPRARFARGALARHVQIRDRTCVGPGCDRSARRSDLDHTHDHALGGATVEGNIGPGCWRHHADKERGWTLAQPQPGRFVWISPLGRTYRTRGEPVRPDLPDPDPAPEDADPRDDPGTTDAGRLDLRILWRQGRNPAPLPPPAPDTEEEPPF
jgi:hypothetical protein